MSEIPVHSRPRRLVDWINPTGARKVHSLIDKGSSTGSTVGLCGAFGRIGSSGGAMVAGDSYRKPCCMASAGWST